ncbi:MAG: protein kinase [Myxococcota bacterium]
MASEPKICPVCGTAYDAGALFCQRDGSRLTTALAAPDPFLGTVLLGQFRIDEAVGQGGMGTVYRATQTTLGRNVAVKILHPELTQNPDAVRRFHREARVATALEHPNLVRVFLFGELPEDQGLYLVMEFLEGRSLTSLLRDEGALPFGRALHLATQIADAVGHAHGKGIVHRDVKPENVHVVTRHGDPDFVKVLDFGIARLLWDDQSVMTQSGVIFGTARYISPEGAAGEVTDARSDVYSIGVVLYQLLAGRTPFDASSPVSMLMKHIHDTPKPLSRRTKNVPRAVEDVVMRALAKNPDARFANAGELAEALRAAAAASGIALRPGLGQRPSLAPGVLEGATPTPVTGPVSGYPPGVFAGAIPGASLPPGALTPSAGTTAPTASAGYGAPSGAYGPSPYATSGPMQVPGLAPRGPKWWVLALAFLLGAGAVAGGAQLAVQTFARSGAAATETLARDASAALEAGRFAAPPGDNVLDLAGRLETAGAAGEARGLRARAAETLRAEGLAAGRRGDLTLARERLTLARRFAPEPPEVSEALAAFERAAVAFGLELAPPVVVLGHTVSMVLHLPPEEAGADVRFDLYRGSRRVAQIPGVAAPVAQAAAGTFVASWRTVRRASYEVRAMVEEAERYRATLEVVRTRPAVARRPRTPAPSMVAPGSLAPRAVPAPTPRTQPTPVPPARMARDEGIDWSLPAPDMTGAPAPGTTPPPPAAGPAPATMDGPRPSRPAPLPTPALEPEPPPPWTGSVL